MTNEFSVLNIENDLEKLQLSVEAIDMEAVKERTLKRIATEMSEMVRQAVVAEPKITSPALNSPYTRGPGPSMATRDAWVVKKDGNDRYTVSPHPKVRQRAGVLNFGYPGTITADDGGYLKFTIDGVPTYRKEVEGPDETGYWQAAYQKINQSDKLRRIANEELEDEVEDKF